MDKKLLIEQELDLSNLLKGKTIMISGSTGLIGSRTVLYLLGLNRKMDAKIKVIALFRNEEKKNDVFKTELENDEITFLKCDIENSIEYVGNIDYVIHCAGLSGGSKMHLKDPVKIFDTGIKGTKNMLDLAVPQNCKGFLYVSTYEIYGDTSQSGLIAESQSCNLDTFSLRNCYAEVKRLCESLCCAYSAKFGINVYSARLTSTFGRGVNYNDPRFFAEFARCAVEGEDIVLKSSGTTVRSYLDSDDAASALLYILTVGENCNAYNLTNMNNEISVREIANKIIEISDAGSRLIISSGDSNTQSLGMRKEGRTVMDASKLMSLGWKPAYSLDDTIIKLLEAIRSAEKR